MLIDVVPLSWSDSTSVSLVSSFVIDASSYAVFSWSWGLFVFDSVFMLMDSAHTVYSFRAARLSHVLCLGMSTRGRFQQVRSGDLAIVGDDARSCVGSMPVGYCSALGV